jgi:hypothetical protein
MEPDAGASAGSGGSKLEALVAERMVERAVLRLGLTFAETSALVVLSPGEEHASWQRDEASGVELLVLGPTVSRMDVGTVEMVLRQQILHRSMYHGFGEQYRDRELADLCLEICINRLLCEGYGDAMRKACAAIYGRPPWAGTGAMLASPTADPVALPPGLSELWTEIWRRDSDGTLAPLNPASLYYRLVRLRNSGSLDQCRGTCRSPGAGQAQGQGDPPPKQPPQRKPGGSAPRLERLVGCVATDLNRSLPRGSSLGRALAQYSVVPVQLGTDDVEAFLQRMAVRKLQQETASKILEPLARRILVQPYPAFPTRLGLVYQLCGVSDAFGLYWNREVFNVGAKLAVGIYLDVSGSMIPHFPIVAGFVQVLKEVPLRLRSFDTEVRELDADDLAAGRVVGGGGTDFDAPIRDLLGAREVEAGVLFTDGEASLDPALGQQLRRARKRLYVVYIVDRALGQSPLDRYATSTITVRAR